MSVYSWPLTDEQDNFVCFKCTSFSSEKENIVLQWELKLNNAVAK
jgi:hypothetical protein